jgi:hypothetical protein
MDKKINNNLELLVYGRPDKGLNYDIILESFNNKSLEEQVLFINEVCNILNMNDSNQIESTKLKVSEVIFIFLEIPYTKKNNQMEVEAISRNNLDINKCDTYLLNVNAEDLVEAFGSSRNKILVKDDKLGDKLFDAIYKPKKEKNKVLKPY